MTIFTSLFFHVMIFPSSSFVFFLHYEQQVQKTNSSICLAATYNHRTTHMVNQKPRQIVSTIAD